MKLILLLLLFTNSAIAQFTPFPPAPVAPGTLNTKGDVLTHDGATDIILGVGADGQVLKANSAVANGVEWGTGYVSPTTTLGDIIVNDGGGSGSDSRVPVGTDGQLLTVVSGSPAFADAPVSTTLTAKGEMQGHDGVNNVSIPVGVDGSFPVYDSTKASGVGSSTSIQGKFSQVSDWEPYTPIINWTNTTASGSKRRVGDTLEMQITLTLTGAPSGGTLDITLPDSLVADQAKMSVFGNQNSVGFAYINDASTSSNNRTARVNVLGANPIILRVQGNEEAPTTPTVPFGFGNTDAISMFISVPIVGWTNGLDGVVESKTLTPLTDNRITVNIETLSSGNQCNITSSAYDLTGFVFCTRNSTGNFTLDYTGLSLTSSAGILFGCEKNNCEFSDGSFPSLTSVNIIMEQDTTAADGEITVEIVKNGANYNKNVIQAATLEDVTYTPSSGAGSARICSWTYDTSFDECTNIVGNCISDCEATGAGLNTVTWNTNYWDAVQYNCSDSAGNDNRIFSIDVKSNGTMTAEARNPSNALLSSSGNYNIICHGKGQ